MKEPVTKSLHYTPRVPTIVHAAIYEHGPKWYFSITADTGHVGGGTSMSSWMSKMFGTYDDAVHDMNRYLRNIMDS